MKTVFLATVLVLVGVGCGGSDIEGSWESDQKIAGKRHEFTLDGDNKGDGTFYLELDGGVYKCKADVSGKEKHEGKFSLELSFRGDCNTVPDYEMDCSLKDDDKKLDCDGVEFNKLDDEI